MERTSGKSEHTDDIEIKLLLSAIYDIYGYDFRDYSPASLKRRLNNILTKFDLSSYSSLQHEIIHNAGFFKKILNNMTVTTTDMFRDPSFYKDLRDQVLPFLSTFPSIRVWHAGCSTGEEVYSLAILLTEEGLYDRTTIYATDINPQALKAAQEGIYDVARLPKFTTNYRKAGGKKPFSDYYTVGYGSAKFNRSLSKNIVFAEHNLATDGVFAEMHLVLCRNVLIYFSSTLQNKVIKLFCDSLRYRGFLCLGSKESLMFAQCNNLFDSSKSNQKIYQKIDPHEIKSELTGNHFNLMGTSPHTLSSKLFHHED